MKKVSIPSILIRLAVILYLVLSLGALELAPVVLSAPPEEADLSAPGLSIDQQLAPAAGRSAPEPFALSVNASLDSWVDETRPDTNLGHEPELTVGQASAYVDEAHALLWFTLSELPADAEVVSATLALYSESTSPPPFQMDTRAIAEPWGEYQVTWNNRPESLTTDDPPAAFVPGGWTVWDVTTLAQDWAAGHRANFGIMVIPATGTTGYRSFSARSTSEAPVLTVHYFRRAEFSAWADAFVDAAQPDTNFGTYSSLRAYNDDQVWSLVTFDITSLPDTFTVLEAELKMYAEINRGQPGGVLDNDLYADAITSFWHENFVAWNWRPGHDYLGDPPTTYQTIGYTTWDVANIVQAWGDGTLTNYGIRVWSHPAGLGGTWRSRENTDPPLLEILYGPAPPACQPVTSVHVSGITEGVTGTAYTFETVLSPPDADPPTSITWQVTDYPDPLEGSSVELTWNSPGQKSLEVTVAHCGGTSATTHLVQISDPPPGCAVPVVGLRLQGPLVVSSGSPATFSAIASPHSATPPFTFTWDATHHGTTVVHTSDPSVERAFTWLVPGAKVITASVENCGGLAYAYRNLTVADPAALPDLRVSNAWILAGGGAIAYVVHNDGDTAAPGGFFMALHQGSSTVAIDLHTSPVAAHSLALGYIDHEWGCGQSLVDVAVEVDWNGVISETDEANNQWTDVWSCDLDPPSFASGPLVSHRTATQALVSWTMDEPCEGWVEYGLSVYSQPMIAPDPGGLTLAHSVQLSNLIPGTAYYARAHCTDAADLTTNSSPRLFETYPLGQGPPAIRDLWVAMGDSSMYEFWWVALELEDDEEMDRVTCSLDGVPLGSAFSPSGSSAYPTYYVPFSPYHLGLTRDQFFGSHSFSCTAYRLDPTEQSTWTEDLAPPGDSAYHISLGILEPNPGHILYTPGGELPPGTVLEAEVRAMLFEWACSWSGFSEPSVLPPALDPVICSDLPGQPVDQIDLFLDNELIASAAPAPGQLVVALSGDISGLALGSHDLGATAVRGASSAETSQHLHVLQGEGGLEISRSVRRLDNVFRVTLDLYNGGAIPANVNRLVDHVIGLQPILSQVVDGSLVYHLEIQEVEMVPYSNYSGYYDRGVAVRFDIDQPGSADYLQLLPGESASVSYLAVPILPENPYPPSLGTPEHPLEAWLVTNNDFYSVVAFDLSGTLVDDPSYGMLPLEQAMANAVKTADYLIVSVPLRIYNMMAAHDPDDEVEALFSNLAHLAMLRNGVLGGLYTYQTHPLDDLIEPGGYWAEALNPVFKQNDGGYVLLVGETEIMPSHYVSDDYFGGTVGSIDESDLWYAHTGGQSARPELVLGRLIGNEVADLNGQVLEMIGILTGQPGYFGFDASDGLVVSGGGEGNGSFRSDAERMEVKLNDRGVSTTRLNMTGVVSLTQLISYQTHITDQDLVFYRGHGYVDNWTWGFQSDYVKANYYNFGQANAVVFAAACQTGNYERGDDLNLAELVLARRPAVYLGSTENSERTSNRNAFRALMGRWQDDESFGVAVTQVKRILPDFEDGSNTQWIFEYNLYGDPRYAQFGGAPMASAADRSMVVTPTLEGANVKITLPEWEIETVDGYHQVSLPGGLDLGEEGGYLVPIWKVAVDLPPGQEVQDVLLTGRTNLVITGSIDLPLWELAYDGAPPMAPPAAPAATGWYPALDRVLNWSVEEAADGSSTVYITLFPVNYHADTGDLLYYRTFMLSVETFASPVELVSLSVAPGSYEPGDEVPLLLTVDAATNQRTVAVQVSVRSPAVGAVVEGLPLLLIDDLEGRALLEINWSARHVEAGDYGILVELFDASGRLLDTATTDLRLGTPAARVSWLGASPEVFVPGDPVSLDLRVVNTGTVPLTGTAVWLLRAGPALSITEIITAPVSGLAPGRSTVAHAVWDSSGASEIRYQVMGYFRFQSQTTAPEKLWIHQPVILLPVVVRK